MGWKPLLQSIPITAPNVDYDFQPNLLKKAYLGIYAMSTFWIFTILRPANALSKVLWSAYSKTPPTGRPRARRVRCTVRFQALAHVKRGGVAFKLGLVPRYLPDPAPFTRSSSSAYASYGADALDGESRRQHVVAPGEPSVRIHRQYIHGLYPPRTPYRCRVRARRKYRTGRARRQCIEATLHRAVEVLIP
jgi:hypothetical protein